ncbi:hypothetical protein FACS189456_7260 [Bacteroidia bacterium]|nr:hypothetical protein FACS189456_7260 [Bacteroidia bacterium]
MILNKYGKIVDNEWQNLTNKYPHINLYEYAIMPNHFHGIVQITDVAVDAPLAPVGAGFARHDFARPDIIQRDNTRNDNDTTNHETGLEIPDANIVNRASGRANPAPTNANGVTLGNIIAYFKYQTTKKIDLPYKLWQRNYYEHIIRNKQSHKTISDYIITNPAKWRDDKLFIE